MLTAMSWLQDYTLGDKSGRVARNRLPRGFALQWHITERCNWRCAHCYQSSYDTPETNLEGLLRVRDQFIAFLNSFDVPPRGHIQITGGEPFLRTDIMDFLREVARYNNRWTWQVLTNGSLLDAAITKELAALGVYSVQVSLEGLEPTNDSIRGHMAFVRTIRAIEILVAAGIKTVVSLTVSRKNWAEVVPLAKFLAPLGVRVLGVRRLVPWGSGAAMRDLLLEPAELLKLYRDIEETNRRLLDQGYPLEIVGGCDSGFFYDRVHTHSNGRPLMSKRTCAVRFGNLMVIMPDGTIVPCRRLPIPVGNLASQTLTQIYHSPAMRRFRETTATSPDVCALCPNWRVCRGGALCVSYAFTGRLDMPDIQCDRTFWSLDEARLAASRIR